MSIASLNRFFGGGGVVSSRTRSESGLREILILIGLAAIAGLIVAVVHPKRPAWAWSRPAVEAITLGELFRSKRAVLWVDARAETAFALKHAPGALSLNEDNWERRLPVFMAVWQPSLQVVVYCDAERCTSSQRVAGRLKRELKIERVSTLAGGWAALEKNGTP